jgi:hypothetical protein
VGGMAISPFNARPASPETERRLARLVVAIALVGIAATLLAYAISPGVRHAVGHAAHGVKGAVGHVFDHDHHHRHRHVATVGAKVAEKRSSSSTARTRANARHHGRTSSTSGSKQPTGP